MMEHILDSEGLTEANRFFMLSGKRFQILSAAMLDRMESAGNQRVKE